LFKFQEQIKNNSSLGRRTNLKFLI